MFKCYEYGIVICTESVCSKVKGKLGLVNYDNCVKGVQANEWTRLVWEAIYVKTCMADIDIQIHNHFIEISNINPTPTFQNSTSNFIVQP